MTVIAPSLHSPVTGEVSNPQAFMAMRASSIIPESTEEAIKEYPRSCPMDGIDEKTHDDVNSSSNQSSPGDENVPQKEAAVDNLRKPCKMLELFVMKASPRDDIAFRGEISRKFLHNKVPLQQADIYEQLNNHQGGNLSPVLDTYMELFEYERAFIARLINDKRHPASLVLLRRTYRDMINRGILFKDIPELQFIIEILKDDRNDEESVLGSPGSVSHSQRYYGPVEENERNQCPDLAVSGRDEYPLLHTQLAATTRILDDDRIKPGLSNSSDDSDESNVETDPAMDDEEAEKAVKELLGKYTMLGAFGGEVNSSG